MPSTTFTPTCPPSRLTPTRGSSPGRCSEPIRINGPAIFASVSVSLALVLGVLVWIVRHPHRAASPVTTTSDVLVALPAAPLAPPRTPVLSVTPVSDFSPAREARSCNIPLVETYSPPLLSPASPQPKQGSGQIDRRDAIPGELSLTKQPSGETYGTKVLFLNNREAAADKARNEHKLLFVIHISGNFEDACFT